MLNNIDNSYRLSDSCWFRGKCIHKYLILRPHIGLVGLERERYDFYIMPCEESDIYITSDFIKRMIAARSMQKQVREIEVANACCDICIKDPYSITDQEVSLSADYNLVIPWKEWEKIAIAFGIEYAK
jgi:hypothetical protein